MTVTKLKLNSNKKLICPQCNGELRFVEGGAVRVVNGKVDMDATLPRHICDRCGVFYRELLGSGYYDVFDLPKEDRKLTRAPLNPPPTVAPKKSVPNIPSIKKRVISTGDIPPTILKREADGKCPCPRCGDRMNFVEAGPVQIINGVPDFSNTIDHFVCPYCKSVFRKIVGTDYFQWSEK